MKKVDFLFEIGTEEIPAGYINNAIEKLKECFINDLQENKLTYEQILVYSTPRRLAVKVQSLDVTQNDETIEKSGPAKKAAYDEQGNLTKAGHGFLKGSGAEEKDIYTVTTPKGEYLAVKIFLKGKETKEILPLIMKNSLEKLVFPKTMKWGSAKFSFARPVRWIVAMLDDEIIDFNFNGLRADKFSYGNRFEKLDNIIEINHPRQYPDILKSVKVIADRTERKDLIKKQINDLSSEDLQVAEDERLLDTVTDLVEYPTAVMANFSEKYLILPSKIITSTLTQNQKYFSILNKNGDLSNSFVFISNGDPEHSDIIRIGNEKVVKARLEDAQFYFQEDTKKPLTDYVNKLSDVVFQAKLGTLLEKTERTVQLCKYLAKELLFDEITTNDLIKAAQLAKADLVTLMLGEKEFTKLQGYIGMNYALINNEKSEIAKAIYEHYMPRGQNDDLPSNKIGAVLAIADKLDTVCGIIGVGLVPTGSNDPFALRRAANGIVQIIDKYGFNVSLTELVNQAFINLSSKITDAEKSKNVVNEYIKQRVKWLLETQNIDYDVIDALNIFEWAYLTDIKNRALDLQKFKMQKEFEILVSGFKRVSNILDKNIVFNDLNPEYLQEKNEISLYKNLHDTKEAISPLLEKMAYHEIMSKIVPLGADIDAFFDNVLVMCDDEKLKNNRLALLKSIRDLFLRIADIAKINYENQ